MILFPAVDIKDGNAVRLTKGDFNTTKIYYKNPVDAAINWIGKGAAYLHIVDLNGSKDGGNVNIEHIRSIASLGVPIQLGGGVRELTHVEKLFNVGVKRVILGTKALDKAFLKSALDLGEIVVSLDGEGGILKTQG